MAAKRLQNRISGVKIERLLDGCKAGVTQTLEFVSPNNVKVTAVNLSATAYRNPAQLVEQMESYVLQAVENKAQLLCLPQYTGMLPLSLFAHFDELEHNFIEAVEKGDKSALEQIASFFNKELSDALFDCHYRIFSRLAKMHQIYIQPGSIFVLTNDGLRNRACLFDPKGELVLEQDKLYLSKAEHLLGVEAGTEPKTVQTLLGKLSVLIGEDNLVFEPAKWAAAQGCKLILSPCGGEGYSSIKSYQGALAMRCQENHFFGVQTAMLYKHFPLEKQGLGGVFCPYPISKTNDGVISYLKNEGVFTARMDIKNLSRLVDVYTEDKNAVVYRSLAEKYQQLTVPKQPHK